MRRSLIIAALAALLLVGSVAPAGATPPADVEFVAVMDFQSGPAFGPFTASGPAVDDGPMCASGDVIQVFGKASGFQSAKGYGNFQVIHQFTCGDGSGDFLVKLQVRANPEQTDFRWNIVGGTGDYEDLHGTGEGVGLPGCGEDCVVDVYNGGLHIDP